MNEIYQRNCPICNKKLSYTNLQCLNAAIRKNYKCRCCSKLGKNNPFYGKKHNIELLKNHSSYMKNIMKGKNLGKNNGMYGYKRTKKELINLSKKFKGKNNPMYGKKGQNHPAYGRTVTQKERTKKRLLMIEKLKEIKKDFHPSFNKTAFL